MRWTPFVAGSATILLGLMLCGQAYKSLASPAVSETNKHVPAIEAIRELAELTVLEVEATEVVTHSIAGHTGSTTAIVLVTGTITLGVDLEQARIVQINNGRQHLVLGLPPPTVQSVAINHDASRVASCQRSGLWELAVGEAHEDRVIAEAFATGQRRLEAAGTEERFIQRARRHAEAVVERFAREAGWTVEIRWDG